MRLLAVFVAMGFRRWSTYRLATAAGAFNNTVFGLIKVSIATAAIGAAGGTLAGYDAATGATYTWLAQALIAPVNTFGWSDLAPRIRTGDIAVDLSRPVDPQLAYLAADLGRAAFQFLPRGLPPLTVGVLTTGLVLPDYPAPYLLGVVSVVVAVVLSSACVWLVNLTAFWLLDVRGATTLYVVTAGVFTGLLLPVHWFPAWLRTIANLTPFPSMLQVPIDVLTAQVDGVDALTAVGVQTGWVLAMLGLGRLVFARGVRTLVVQGG